MVFCVSFGPNYRVLDVRMLGNFRADRHLQLSIADGQPTSFNVKPHKVYQGKLPHKMEGLEAVLPVNKIMYEVYSSSMIIVDNLASVLSRAHNSLWK